ncbi:MAG: hypothetical protein M1530_00740 [Candidatus Marsarchaeota archaeon]|nr:hypothetical protein [Candidatus Marsarchaeota archaeon]
MAQSFGGHRSAVSKLVFPTSVSVSPLGVRITGVSFGFWLEKSGPSIHPKRRIELKTACASGRYAPLGEDCAKCLDMQNDAMLVNEATRRLETLAIKVKKKYDYGAQDFKEINELISRISSNTGKVALLSELLFISLQADLPRRLPLALVSDLSDMAEKMQNTGSRKHILQILDQIFYQATLGSRVDYALAWKLLDKAHAAWRQE